MTKEARKTNQKKFFIYTLIIGIALFSPSFDICAANSGQRIEGANGALVIEGGIKETTETQTDATGHMGPYQKQWEGSAIAGLAVGSRAKAYFGSVAIGDNPSVNSRYGIGIGSDAFIDRRSDTDLDSDIGKTFGNRQQAGASVRSIAIGTSSSVLLLPDSTTVEVTPGQRIPGTSHTVKRISAQEVQILSKNNQIHTLPFTE